MNSKKASQKLAPVSRPVVAIDHDLDGALKAMAKKIGLNKTRLTDLALRRALSQVEAGELAQVNGVLVPTAKAA